MASMFDEFLRVPEDAKRSCSRGDCGLCSHPVVDQLPEDDRYIRVEGKEILVHTDCYDSSLGEEIERCPVGRKRLYG